MQRSDGCLVSRLLLPGLARTLEIAIINRLRLSLAIPADLEGVGRRIELYELIARFDLDIMSPSSGQMSVILV